jgi:AcrR family transcriptional regulator
MKPTTSRRERAKADKMRRILAAAAKLFSKNGFSGTTVQQIADEADVAVGTLFLYVADKSELLLLLHHQEVETEFKKAARRLDVEENLIASLTRFLSDLMRPYEKNLELSKVVVTEYLFHTGRVKQKLDDLTAAILQVVRERILAAQATGEVDRSVDVEVAVFHIHAIYHSTLAFFLADCLPSASPQDTLAALLQSLWQGMRPCLAERD